MTKRSVGSKERYIASAHRSGRNSGRQADVYAWPWIGIELNWQQERTERENNWSSLTGRVVANRQSEIYNLQFSRGVLAQLVERLNGIEEVTGSNPVGSTSPLLRTAAVVAQLCDFVLIT